MTMRRARFVPWALTFLVAVAAVGSRAAAAENSPATTAEKPAPVAPEVGSYDIGLMLGSELKQNGVSPVMSVDAVIRGLKDALGGRSISAEERDAASRFMHDARDVLAEKNRTAGREFLARNAKQPGVVSTPSGLQYKIAIAGDSNAKSPALTDQVSVRYQARFADGTVFDRSDNHERPAIFRVNSVLKGWREALLAMKPGAKWQLFVPSDLAYAANPPFGVPPGALVIFDLELLQVEPTPPMDPAAAKRPAAGLRLGLPPAPRPQSP